MNQQTKLSKELKTLGFLTEMRMYYLRGEHKKHRYIVARKYKVGNVPMKIIEKFISNEINEQSVVGFVNACREYRAIQEIERKKRSSEPEIKFEEQSNLVDNTFLLKILIGLILMDKDEFELYRNYLKDYFASSVYNYCTFLKG